jgi:hypothetical protein
MVKELFHIRLPHGKELANKKNIWKSQDELGHEFPLTITLRPQIPNATMEDNTTPRVSLSRSIRGAAGSLGLRDINPDTMPHFGIYAVESSIEIVEPFDIPTPNNIFYVHDAKKWQEVWSLRPVIANLIRIVAPGEKI